MNKMVHKLLISLTHTTSVHYNNVPLYEVSMVRILPRAADHAKKAALKGTSVHHTFFQEKRQPSLQLKEK
jgi:hypothetical protein